jgi:hypothetical protein
MAGFADGSISPSLLDSLAVAAIIFAVGFLESACLVIIHGVLLPEFMTESSSDLPGYS